jgi:hypothetical protein
MFLDCLDAYLLHCIHYHGRFEAVVCLASLLFKKLESFNINNHICSLEKQLATVAQHFFIVDNCLRLHSPCNF